jgi:HSP20 family protein
MRTLVKKPYYPASNSFIDAFFGKDFFGFPSLEKNILKTTPAVNVKETENEFVVEIAIPGIKKEDVKVELNENVLSISSELKKEENKSNDKYTRKEFSYSTFKRSFTIDEDAIDADNVEAKFENGILNVHLAKKVKTEPEKRVKTIAIT